MGKDDDRSQSSVRPNVPSIDLRSVSQAKADELTAVRLKIAGVVTFYCIVSMSMVFLNKFIMSNSQNKLPLPLVITWFQFIVATVCVSTLMKNRDLSSTFSFLPPFSFDLKTALSIAPLTFICVGMIASNNYCLKLMDVAFYQVARSLTIVFNILFTYTILGKTTSSKAIFACSIVLCGFVLGAMGEAHFTIGGAIAGVSASVFVSLYSIYVKRCLPLVENNEWSLLLYNNVNATVLLLPILFMTGEAGEAFHYDVWSRSSFWMEQLAAGVMGFLINIATFLQIKHTSPLTNVIVGTAKACMQTVVGVILFNIELSTLKVLGIMLVVGGSGYYSYVRNREMEASRTTLPK